MRTIGSLSSDHGDGNENGKEPDRQNNNFARASRFFVHFFAERELLPFAVVQKVDSAIRWINLYPVDNAIAFPNTCPLDGDL